MNGDFRTFGVKGNSRLHAGDVFPFGGRSSLKLIGESWLTEQYLNAVSGGFNPLRTVASHIRMVIEGTHVRTLAAGHSVSPSVSIGMRRDDRNGLSALGYEIGSSVECDASQGLSIEASGLVVTSGSNRIHEWEFLGSMDYDAGSDGLGLLVSMQPAWGATGVGERNFMWKGSLLDASDRFGIRSNDARIESEVGYGFTMADDNWTLTPYAAVTMDKEQSNEIRIGSRLRTGKGLNFEIEGWESVGTCGSSYRDIRLIGDIRW